MGQSLGPGEAERNLNELVRHPDEPTITRLTALHLGAFHQGADQKGIGWIGRISLAETVDKIGLRVPGVITVSNVLPLAES